MNDISRKYGSNHKYILLLKNETEWAADSLENYRRQYE